MGKVIALFTNKGGAGKTTLCACLAAEWTERGRDVALMDCDPHESLAQWHGNGDQLRELPLQVVPTASAGKLAREAARGGGIVLVDLPGSTTATTVAVLEEADLVLVPCRPSAMDALRALSTLRMVDDIAKARKRPLPARVVMNGVSKRSSIYAHVRRELEGAGVKVAQTGISSRTTFAIAATNGTAPAWMFSQGKAAALEVAMLADEIDLVLRRAKK